PSLPVNRVNYLWPKCNGCRLGGPDEPGHDGRETRGPKGVENGCGCWHAMAFSWVRWVLPAESHRSRLRQPISPPSWPDLFGPPKGRRARCRRLLVMTAEFAALGSPDEPGHDGRDVVGPTGVDDGDG